MRTQAKQRATVKVPTTKMCTCCHQIRKLGDFYSNRDWVDQLGKDAWCKSCAAKAKTKDELRKYFFENNREWSDKLWDSAYKKAELSANKNEVFQKTTDERRESILNQLACQNVLKSMQLSYRFVDNSQNVNINSYEEAKEAGMIVESAPQTKDPNIKTYNAFFNGDFKPAELEYLEEYYRGLNRDFNLSDISLQDNAKKLAKAALTADKIQNDYLAGRCSIQDLNNAIAQYDLLMKTGNFAACKRKPGDKEGMGSWAELTLHLETHGFLTDKLVVWGKDDVDRTIDEFRYITQAIGIDTV